MKGHLLLMVKRKNIPEKGETQPATARQRARLEIYSFSFTYLSMDLIIYSFIYFKKVETQLATARQRVRLGVRSVEPKNRKGKKSLKVRNK